MKHPPFTPAMIASGFGSGFSPLGPGTVGSLVALFAYIGAYLGLQSLLGEISNIAFIGFGIVLSLLSVWAGYWSTAAVIPFWGKDPKKVVIDEWTGMWIALIYIPFEPVLMFLALFWFRLFDIWKPLGIRRLENIAGAGGVMMDDIVAGIAANVVLQIGIHSGILDDLRLFFA